MTNIPVIDMRSAHGTLAAVTDPMDVQKQLGALLREAREDKRHPRKISIRTAARAAGVNPDTFGGFERGFIPGRNGKPVETGRDKITAMFRAVPLQDEYRERLREIDPDLADLVERPADAPAATDTGDDAVTAVEDRYIEEGIRNARDRHGRPVSDEHKRVLLMLWQQTDEDERLLPRGVRLKAMGEWQRRWIDHDDENGNGESTASPAM